MTEHVAAPAAAAPGTGKPGTGKPGNEAPAKRALVKRALVKRALAEFTGTMFLVAAVIGSGIAATRLSPHDVGLELLEISVVTGGALVALILALQPVSAAFNPIVTLVERALGAVSSQDAVVLIAAQLGGGATAGQRTTAAASSR